MKTMPDVQQLPWHDSDIYELIIDESSAIVASAICLCAAPDDEDAAPLRNGWLIFLNAQLTSDPVQLPMISGDAGISAEVLRIDWEPSTEVENLFKVKIFVQLIDEHGSDRSYVLLNIDYTTALWCETQTELVHLLPTQIVCKLAQREENHQLDQIKPDERRKQC